MAKKLPLLIISGPCMLESEALGLEVARTLKKITAELGLPFIFKASFDKANRSSGLTARGPGLEAGLAAMGRIKDKLGLKLLTDIHEISQITPAARVIDVLQIPAFLCRQTDLVVAAARSGRVVNVKKGQFLSPEEVNSIAKKIREAGGKHYFITERGTTFGYNNLVVDMRGLEIMRRNGHRVVFDATHSCQRPGGMGDRSGGDSSFAPVLARAAVAVGVHGLFIETHPNPADALSDGPNMIPLKEMKGLLRQLKELHETV
jgi:2-dehydro-3-deoxyphosphooctonate aldolase (KDO 8-P synthase)